MSGRIVVTASDSNATSLTTVTSPIRNRGVVRRSRVQRSSHRSRDERVRTASLGCQASPCQMTRAEMYEPSVHSAVMLEHVSQIAWTLVQSARPTK